MAMNVLDGFNIDIFKLSHGSHNYQFEIGNSFFEAIGDSLIDKGKGVVKADLSKNDSFIKIDFDISVLVELTCDRSLDFFDYNIEGKHSMIFKFGEEDKEIDDEIIMISRGKQRLNVAQYIYEFIGIEVPMKKLHPRYATNEIDDELVYTSSKEDKESNTPIDPRWNKLKGLK